ncbi:ABC transporter permease [Zhihengliuella sp.]|uniref:ABC transporter permease n=1 Tax=Zhihengliuella sp. TaxID=1954483 RepID=UPI0028117D84|nr:ABC transporter permease [Zhihengliuella sp.]
MSERAVEVDVGHLSLRGEKDSLIDYILRVWDVRSFMFHEARTHVSSRGEHQALGNLWLIINPIMDGAVFYIVFGLILQMDKGIPNFIAFLLVGVFCFQMTTRCVNGSSMSIYRWRTSSSTSSLPAIAAPINENLRTWIAGLPSYLVLVVMILALPPLENLSPIAFLVVPVIVLQIGINLGISLIAAHFIARVPDLNNILRVSTRAWMFGSGVMFPVAKFAELGPVFAFIIHWNPMAWVLNHIREVFVYNELPSIEGWLIMILWAVVPLLAGTVLIWRGESSHRSVGDE